MSVTDQLPASAAASNGASSGRVELTVHGLHLDATFSNETLLDFVRDGGLGANPVRQLEDLCVLGLLSSRAGSGHAVAVETRRAESALRSMFMTEAEQHLRNALRRAMGSEGEDGALLPELDRLVKNSTQVFESLSTKLLSELNGSGEKALPQVLDRRVRHAVRDVADGVLQRAFASDGVLAANLKNNAQAIKDLREDLMRLHEVVIRTAAAAEHIDPAKAGRDWQPATLADVARLTHVTGDEVQETGGTPGHGRSKRGDGLMHVQCSDSKLGPKVAIEIRTGSQAVTVRDLAKAKANRNAEAALLLAERVSALPKDAQPLGFRIYPEDAVVVLHYDRGSAEAGVLLATALQVVRHLAQVASGASTVRLDQVVLHGATRRIEACLARLKPLRGAATAIETEVERVRKYVADIEREARSAVGELAGMLVE